MPTPVLDCLTTDNDGARPVHLVSAGAWTGWLADRPDQERRWLEATGFKPEPGRIGLLPAADGDVAGAVLVGAEPARLWDTAALAQTLPAGTWRLVDPQAHLPPAEAILGFALGSHRFERFARKERPAPRLVVTEGAALDRAVTLARSICMARDLVNRPAGDLGPDELEEAALEVASAAGVPLRAIRGDDLLAANYPAIHTVGRAAAGAPRLLDFVWGEETAPKLTLVGKGVCFDTGGLDIKPASNMLLMKKDMGGAALMLALARAITALALPVRLRVLLPVVENSIAGNAFRPGDVITMRSGKTVEVGNTDAEGRLILADALTEADSEHPDLILDAATLTGAARVALGPELPALFTPDEALAADLLSASVTVADPLWRLPLHAGYRRYLKSSVADLSSTGSKPLAGSITAALFLQEFVSSAAWAHLDIFAWNDEPRPGRPAGGEATGFRAVLACLEQRFAA